jgi:hypothetical protein
MAGPAIAAPLFAWAIDAAPLDGGGASALLTSGASCVFVAFGASMLLLLLGSKWLPSTEQPAAPSPLQPAGHAPRPLGCAEEDEATGAGTGAKGNAAAVAAGSTVKGNAGTAGERGARQFRRLDEESEA